MRFQMLTQKAWRRRRPAVGTGSHCHQGDLRKTCGFVFLRRESGNVFITKVFAIHVIHVHVNCELVNCELQTTCISRHHIAKETVLWNYGMDNRESRMEVI